MCKGVIRLHAPVARRRIEPTSILFDYSMARETIPKAVRDELLDSYDHRCAVCGGDRPQVHHIDEDASNNDVSNLLPLCPNCHLRDQHNPTRKVEIPKLRLFRKYRDPAILKPQFHPIYIRQLFLDEVGDWDGEVDDLSELEEEVRELIDLIQALEMGAFYAKGLSKLLGPERHAYIYSLEGGRDFRFEQQRREENREYRKRLADNREKALALIVELLRYQPWANA